MSRTASVLLVVFALLFAVPTFASSHREAPGVLETPGLDATDFYMFNSYESGREGYVTLIANYNPLQDPYGGPNYFPLRNDAFYDIHINNDADAGEDITFRFRFNRFSPFAALPVGTGPGNTETVPVPLVNIGPFGPGVADGGVGNLNEVRSYTLRVVRGSMANPSSVRFASRDGGATRFPMPLDNIGEKSIPNYAAYANNHIFDVQIPGCEDGRVFVGQRKDSFAVNLGEVFDLVNTNPLGPVDGEQDDLADKNVTSIAIEVPTDCLTGSSDIIGGWTTSRVQENSTRLADPTYSSVSSGSGMYQQVSRLGSPLVNEVVIGLPDKNLFNASEPKDDAQFLSYVTNPTLPELLEILFPVTAPNAFPRADLVQVFVTGIPGVTEDGSVGEMLRLNTAIPATASGSQSSLGVVGGDNAGFPNGRRPGDDVVDIALRAAMGVLLPEADAPDGQLPYTDGVLQEEGMFDASFPYVTTPIPGSPN